MKTISQRELRNNSGEVLRAVAAGESMIITNNGKPAAMLSPVPRTRYEQLVAEGRVIPSKKPLNGEPWPTPVTLPPGTINELLELDRTDMR